MTHSFLWRGGDSSWFNGWMGNGLGVSALMLPAIAAQWLLAGLAPEQAQPWLPLAWALFVSFAILSALGFKYFVFRIGVVFGLIAVINGAAAVLLSR